MGMERGIDVKITVSMNRKYQLSPVVYQGFAHATNDGGMILALKF